MINLTSRSQVEETVVQHMARLLDLPIQHEGLKRYCEDLVIAMGAMTKASLFVKEQAPDMHSLFLIMIQSWHQLGSEALDEIRSRL